MATRSSVMATKKEEQLYEELVDALNAIFGTHPGYRAAHAKGIVCEGTFTPAPTAASLSRAPHLQRDSVQLTLRFSDFAGIPTISDADPSASPHGLGIKFQLPSGVDTDISAISYNDFPVGTAEEFLAFLRALAASGPTAPKPAAIDSFIATRPRARAFVTTPKPVPASFVTESYYGINAFKFVNREGTKHYIRYQIHPIEDESHLSDAEAAKRSPNFLFDELAERVKHGPAKLRLVAQVAAAGDPIDDGSIVWPSDRRQVELGIIDVTKLVADSSIVEQELIFDPARLVDGIELSEDPLPLARSAIYSISYKRRNP